MPVVSQTVEVAAPPQVIVSIVTNYEAYPEWNKEITSVDILQRLPDGRPQIVRLKVETSGMSSINVAEIAYLNASQVATRLLESDIFEKQEQTFSIVPMGPTCLLTVDMDVEIKLPIPKPMVKKLANQVLEHLAEALKSRSEQIASGQVPPTVAPAQQPPASVPSYQPQPGHQPPVSPPLNLGPHPGAV